MLEITILYFHYFHYFNPPALLSISSMPTNSDDIRSLLLQQFPLEGQKISLIAYAGEGGAGHVFKISIHNRENKLKKEYALKAVHVHSMTRNTVLIISSTNLTIQR